MMKVKRKNESSTLLPVVVGSCWLVGLSCGLVVALVILRFELDSMRLTWLGGFLARLHVCPFPAVLLRESFLLLPFHNNSSLVIDVLI